jgi:hypothetical protein
MRGSPKINQAVVIKHVGEPIVMHIEAISKDGEKCTCVWQDKIGAPYRSDFNTDVLESYKSTIISGAKKLHLVEDIA